MDIINIEKNHIKNIAQNNTSINTIEMIIGDVLMGKIKKLDYRIIQMVNMTDAVNNLIENWYVMANELKIYNNYAFSVYRGVSNMDNLDIIFQPIPFSTCIEFDNAINWVYDNGFIMKINIKVGDLYTFIGNKYEGNEVILGKCHLKKISTIKQNGIIINEYDII